MLAAAAFAPFGQAQDNSAAADAASAGKPVVITLDDAIRLAQASEPAYAAAAAASRTAGLDRSIAPPACCPT